MKLNIFSYRFAEEILQHDRHGGAWLEIHDVLSATPLFVYPGKSKKNKKLDVVQQLMNTYFDRRLSIDLRWDYHPLATGIKESGLRADFQKKFGDLAIQAEIQFGNMSRWYSDIFKFQAAYSQSLVNVGLSVIPIGKLARRIDSNVVQFERAKRELPSAQLSITLPIMMVGLEQDENTEVVDVSRSKFEKIGDITGKGKSVNRWRIVNGYLAGKPIEEIGPNSEIGPQLEAPPDDDGDDDPDQDGESM